MTVGLPMLILVVWIVIAHDSSPGIAGGLVAIPFVAAMFAGILYVFNLPFLIVSHVQHFLPPSLGSDVSRQADAGICGASQRLRRMLALKPNADLP